MIILYIFKGVGGYVWNPYGLCVLIAICTHGSLSDHLDPELTCSVPDAIPLCWVIYNRPIFFAGALLAMSRSVNGQLSNRLLTTIGTRRHGSPRSDRVGVSRK